MGAIETFSGSVPILRFECPVPGCDWTKTIIGHPHPAHVVRWLSEHLDQHGITVEEFIRWGEGR